MQKTRQLLLLVQSQADVDALPAAADAYNAQGFNALWLLFSPVVLVDTKAVSAEYDGNIAALRAQIEACKSADDFDGAKGYKAQLDDAVMQKTIKVKEAWRTLTEEQQAAAQERVFGPFFAKLPKERIRVEAFREHFEPSFFIDALASVKKAWFVPFTPGSFTMTWASDLGSSEAVPMVQGRIPLPPKPAVQEPEKPRALLPTQHPRFKELVMMGVEGLGQHALTLGINPNGKQILALRHEVFRKEKELGKITA